jgi:hypothetical protein
VLGDADLADADPVGHFQVLPEPFIGEMGLGCRLDRIGPQM